MLGTRPLSQHAQSEAETLCAAAPARQQRAGVRRRTDQRSAGRLALLKFVPDTADYWDAPHSTMIRAFGLLVSVVAGRPIGLGEQGTHKDLAANQTSASVR